MIFRRGAHHAWAADVDILDHFFEAGAAGHRRFERIQIDDDQIDGRDAMFFHLGDMFRIVPQRQDTAVNFRMEGLDPAIHHFRKAGQLGDVFDRNIIVAQQRRGAAGGNQFDAHGREGAGKLDNALFVGNADEGSFNLAHCR